MDLTVPFIEFVFIIVHPTLLIKTTENKKNDDTIPLGCSLDMGGGKISLLWRRLHTCHPLFKDQESFIDGNKNKILLKNNKK